MRRNTLFAIVGVFVGVLVALGVGGRIWGDELAFGNVWDVPTSPNPVPETPTISLEFTDPENGLNQPQSGAGVTTKQVEEAWAPVAEAGEKGEWDTWAVIKDADTGELIFAADENSSHRPASTMKVLTALFALDTLDANRTLATGVSLDKAEGGPQLYLWGEGDLLLGADKGNPNEVLGHAGVGDLARKAAKSLIGQGVDTVTLHYTPTMFAGDKRNPGWVEQGTTLFAGDVAPFAIDTGRVLPGAWWFVDDSAATTAETLAEHLRESGVEVVAVVASEDVPEQAKVVAEVHSAPLLNQIELMLTESDNTMAEQLCHLATQESGVEEVTFAASTQALTRHLEERGVPVEGFAPADCSGLDDTSLVRPGTLVEALQSSGGGGPQVGSLARLLPLGGHTGTLEGRFHNPATYGNVAAKTGTLSVVSSLTGVLTTASGQNLVFAVGNDNVVDSGGTTADNLDVFLTKLSDM